MSSDQALARELAGVSVHVDEEKANRGENNMQMLHMLRDRLASMNSVAESIKIDCGHDLDAKTTVSVCVWVCARTRVHVRK